VQASDTVRSDRDQAGLSSQTLGRRSLVETVLYGEDPLYDWPDSQRRDFLFNVVGEAFLLHYESCRPYRRFCDVSGFGPNSLISPDDLGRIPLIPSSLFKDLDISSIPSEAVAKVCLSSGTRGSISRVSRDTVSLERFLGSIRISAEELLGLRAEAKFFNLGPDSDEAGDIWFSYVMSLLSLLRRAENYVAGGVFRVRSLIEDLHELPAPVQPILVGPPILFLHFMDLLDEEGIRLDLGSRNGFVVTSGGWKRFSSDEIDREEFARRCAHLFGLADRRHVRDAYNMVELNTVLLECEHGAKHVPPWLLVLSLDPETLIPNPSGRMGVLGFVDPLPTSYPGFVLSDDFVRLHDGRCSCGRSGPTLEFCRRVHLVEGRGCALTIERKMGLA
jgi:long-chain-fatty-acid---luciferin-component ligase